LACQERLFRLFALGDIGAYRHIWARPSICHDEGNNGCVEPVEGAVLGPITDLCMPNLAAGDGVVHLLEECPGMMPGGEDAVILADKFLSLILADGAEFVVYVRNRSLHIRHRNNGVLVESEFLVG